MKYVSIVNHRNRSNGKQYQMIIEGHAPDDPKGKHWQDVKQIERDYPLLAK